jgi:hypothetical protein
MSVVIYKKMRNIFKESVDFMMIVEKSSLKRGLF